MTALNYLLQDIHKLETALTPFEEKFGVLSEDFYAAMMQGDLEEFDALDEYRMEFIEWRGLYETWRSFNRKYRQLIDSQSIALQIKISLEPSYA